MDNLKKGDDVKISTIEQVSELSSDQFAIFVEDLKIWHRLKKELEFANEAFREFGLGDNVVQNDSSFIHWVYNNDGNADIKIRAVNEKDETIASAEVNIKQSDIK